MGLFLGISLLSGAEILYYVFKLLKVFYSKYTRTATGRDNIEDIIHTDRVPRFVYPITYPSEFKPSHNNLLRV